VSGALATAPLRVSPGGPATRPAPDEHDRQRGPLTLEERLELELGATLAGREGACPACGGRLEQAGDAAHCGGCGSVLS
jgi:tRNA(Ile2) C34 agmatinyltransferase TiaS